mgnify:CR=1 FL=1
MPTQRITFPGHSGETLSARLDLPAGAHLATAIFAHCFTCGKDIPAARRIAARLAGMGIAVLRFDFTGLGHSEGEFANTSFTSNVDDLVAAATYLTSTGMAPTLLIGHSLGGAAVLKAANKITGIKAVATLGAPFDPGHVTLTGVGFRLGYVVVQTANDIGTFLSALPVLGYFSVAQWALFTSLVLIAVACIIMGAGIPTTATYIILVAVAAPALAVLEVQPIVAHFFVFYYGVLADITPPVALAAYAAAGIAGSNPFKTGNTAFRLGIAKALVPFVFVYSPALLLVADGFTWWLFTITLLGAMLGIASLGVAFSGYLVSTLKTWERWWVALVSFLFIAPGLTTMAIGLVLMMPIAVIQYNRSRVLAD